MSLATIFSRAQLGVDAPLVTVETHLSKGLPGFTIVGLPETAVKESKDRVRSALLNSYFTLPASSRITVNLAPADLPKEGGRYDLAIALGILAASGQVPTEQLLHYEFIGELALSGELRPVQGSIPAAIQCAKKQRTLVLPRDNGAEAALCASDNILVADNLLTLCAHLHGREFLRAPPMQNLQEVVYDKDLREVRGQAQARRALEIAAVGGHNLLFYGPPGSGKSMLASRLPTILPPMTRAEALETAAVMSVSKTISLTDWQRRPYRSPHHTSSAAALVGGGSNPSPGEISLAHNGVLFLDEFPEFSRSVLEVLREPLENGHICISRANARVEYPASFQLVAAMNPCPCGYFQDKSGRCRCTPQQVARYSNKISGPLLDRIDLQVQVNQLPINELQQQSNEESSDLVRQRVIKHHHIQLGRQGKRNAHLQGAEMRRYCKLGHEQSTFLADALTRLNMSARAYDRTLRVARTIADMEQSEHIAVNHLSEALAYRSLDRSASH